MFYVRAELILSSVNPAIRRKLLHEKISHGKYGCFSQSFFPERSHTPRETSASVGLFRFILRYTGLLMLLAQFNSNKLYRVEGREAGGGGEKSKLRILEKIKKQL